ncbi:MAG: response regulator [Gammaproteobacteria bacterium]|nr:response regulator [Gammaproteobacteria bacterium]
MRGSGDSHHGRVPNMSSPTSNNYSDREQAEAVRQLYQGLEHVVLFMPLLPLVLVGGLWGHIDRGRLLVWCATSILVTVLYYILVRKYHAARPDAMQAGRWGRRLTWAALADGLVWGTAGMFFYVPDALPQQLILLALIIGIPAASVFSTSWWPMTQYANAFSSVGLTIVGLAAQGTSAHVGLAIGLAVYLLILVQITRQAHGAARETIALRFENLDLIEQLRHEKQLAENADLAKSKFLAAASHDLRQPLHALGLFIAALNERIHRPETRGLMGNINCCVVALEGLFNALLDISKLDAGVVYPQVRNVSLALMFEQLVAEYAPQAEAKGLEWHAPGIAPVVLTDPVLLERILRNLISNAIRYTTRGEVRLTCNVVGNEVCLEVSDTGIGIPVQSQHEVFREFVQLHNPERDRTKGLGLGLAIVQRTAQLLGHRLEMHSTPGVGTSFRLFLPAGDPTAVNTDPSGEAQLLAPESRERLVLVIDDEMDVRLAMTTLLESWGYVAAAFASAEEALATLKRIPDAIIADYRLREERTGVEAIAAIQAHFGAEIPALLVTGDTSIERIRQAKDSGFSFLHKPIAPAKLRSFLRTVCPR